MMRENQRIIISVIDKTGRYYHDSSVAPKMPTFDPSFSSDESESSEMGQRLFKTDDLLKTEESQPRSKEPVLFTQGIF